MASTVIDILSLVGDKPNVTAGRTMKRDGRPTKRAIEIGRARVAGYHGDSRAYTLLLVERRTASQEALRQAWTQGSTMRKRGVRCSCPDCSATASTEKP